MTPEESRRIRTILFWGFLAVAGYLLLTVILILIKGGEWNHIIAVNNPKKRMAAGVFFLAYAYLARTGWRKTRSEWLQLAGRLALLAVSLGVSFLLGEQAVRGYLRRNQGFGSLQMLKQYQEGRNIELKSFHPLAAIVRLSPNKKLVYELIPGLDMKFGHKQIRTNRHGMRDSMEYTEEKPPATIRIVGVGDSGMFGWNVEQDEDFLSVLEATLAARGGPVKVEVLNMGVPGYNTHQEVETVRSRALAFKPDIVILGWCDNDFGAPFFLCKENNFDRRDLSYLYALVFNRALFRELVKPQICKSSELDATLVDPTVLEYTRSAGVRKALSELKEMCIQAGFKVLIWGPMGRDATALCEELGLDYANTWAEIPKGKYPENYAIHFMHPRAEGHRVLGEQLAVVLDRKGWLKP